MNILDSTGTFNENLVIKGMQEIEDMIKEESEKEVVDGDKLTKLRFEQMLRGIYMTRNPYQPMY
jgi:hypothetical protein